MNYTSKCYEKAFEIFVPKEWQSEDLITTENPQIVIPKPLDLAIFLERASNMFHCDRTGDNTLPGLYYGCMNTVKTAKHQRAFFWHELQSNQWTGDQRRFITPSVKGYAHFDNYVRMKEIPPEEVPKRTINGSSMECYAVDLDFYERIMPAGSVKQTPFYL